MMLIAQNPNVSKESVTETPLSLATPEMEAEEERLWQEEFSANRDFYMTLADEALEEYKQGKTLPLEAMLAKTKNKSWLNTVGKYPEDSPLNRMPGRRSKDKGG